MHTDSTGYWFGLDDAIAFTVGAVAGAVGQLISDMITLSITGEWHGTWESYVGAAVGYGIGAVSTLYLGPVSGFAIGGGLSTFMGQGLQKLNGTNDRSWGAVFLNSSISAGRNSWSAVFKSGLTKIGNGNASSMSFGVFMKGLGSTIIARHLVGNIGKGVFDGTYQWWEYTSQGDTQGLGWI